MTRSWQAPSHPFRSNLNAAFCFVRIAALALLVAALPAYAQRGGGGHGGGGGHAGGGGHLAAGGHAGAHAASGHLVAGRAGGAHLVAGSRYSRTMGRPYATRYLTYIRAGGAVHHPVPGASTRRFVTTNPPFLGPFDFFGGSFGRGRFDRFGFGRGGYGAGFGYWPWWGWDEGWDDWETGCDYASPYYPGCLNGQGSNNGYPESREQSNYDTDTEDASRPMIMVYLKDGSGYGALDYWLTNGTFYIETTYGAQKSFPLDQVDVHRTFTENTARGVTFTLSPTPLASDPGPMFAPDSYAPDCPTPAAAPQSSSSATSSSAVGSTASWFGATGTSSDRGLTVASVRPDSPAAQIGVQPGDVVVRVNCQHVRSAQDIESAANTGSGPIWVSYMIRGAWLTDKKLSR